MAVTTSRVGTVIDALVAALRLNPGLADPARVYDGPVTQADTYWMNAVFIGFDGSWPASLGVEVDGCDFNQSLDYLGNTSMFEEFDLLCCAQGWTGDATPQVCRNQALTMFAAVQQTVRTNETLGVDGSTVAGMRINGSLRYVWDSGGNMLCRIPFQLHVITTLLTV